MRELTVNEQLFRRLMHVTRKMRMSMPPRPEGPMHRGPECEGRPPMDGEDRPMKRPPLAREHLMTIIGKHDGIHQKDLAERMHVNPSTMSEFINHLEDDGYVVRTVDPDDKRATLITLSDKGAARVAELQDEREEQYSRLFGNLSEEEKDQLNDLLKKMIGDDEHHHRRHHRREEPIEEAE